MNISLAYVERELRLEDIEGLIEAGAPDNEYDSEAKELADALATLANERLTGENVVAIISLIWARSFNLDDVDLEKRLSAFHRVAQKILQE